MSNIANIIIENAMSNRSLLNWDGETSHDDMIENIRSHVSNHTGWKYLSINFESDTLKIYAKNRPEDTPEFLLSYNVKTGREIYGRIRTVGFSLKNIDELKTLLSF